LLEKNPVAATIAQISPSPAKTIFITTL